MKEFLYETEPWLSREPIEADTSPRNVVTVVSPGGRFTIIVRIDLRVILIKFDTHIYIVRIREFPDERHPVTDFLLILARRQDQDPWGWGRRCIVQHISNSR